MKDMSAKTENLFEKKLKRLQEIVSALESGDLPLEKGMALYKEGAACSRYCRQQLEKARHDIELWQDGQAFPLKEPESAENVTQREEDL